LDEHPLVRVAAAATAEWNEGGGRRRPRPRNPRARGILAAASIPRRRALAENVVAAVEGIGPEMAATGEGPGSALMSDATLIHGTWARKQRWWPPGGEFHDFLRSESRVFPGLYSGSEPWEWSGQYGFRTRLPRQRSDWNRSQAGGALAWWTHRKLRCPPHLIGHSCGASVAMLATRVQLAVRALVLLSPSVHRSCLPDPAFYRGALVVCAHDDLVLTADGSDYDLLRNLPNVKFAKVPRRGLTGHTASHDPACWRAAGLDACVRDRWLPGLQP
jgi:hypothetical protein